MKKLTLSLLTLAFSAGMVLPAMAQGVSPTEMNSFEGFLSSHPNTARELQQNPNLINDPKWMGHHQGLEEYMSDHPNARTSLHENPGAFMGSESHWMSGNGGFRNNSGDALGNRFDQGYLDEHPEVSQQLAKNPGLADNPQYLSAHPGLHDYLNAHPEISNDLKYHPDRFMSDADHSGAYNHSGPFAEGGYHGQAMPPNTYHPAPGYGGPEFAAEHPYTASHPNAAAHYYAHHHHQQ